MGNEKQQAGEKPAGDEVAALTVELEAKASALDALAADHDALRDQYDAVVVERDGLLAQVGRHEQDIKEIAHQRDAAVKALDAARSETEAVRIELASAKKEAAVRKKGKSPTARDAKPIGAPVDRKTLADAMANKPHEVVFSDGSHEIIALEPLVTTREAWSVTGRGIILTKPVTITPSERVTLGGFALFDGKDQVAWCPLSVPVVVDPGKSVKLDRQIIF